MTVFKAFWKIVNRYKLTIIIYTVILIVFAGMNMQTNDIGTNFVASKPKILIINNDENTGITKNLIDYMSHNCEIVDIKGEEAINDALFYRDVSYIIYIPQNFGENFIYGLNPEIEIKKTDTSESSLAQMMIERYIKTAKVYISQMENEEELISNINDTLSKETEVEITSKLDTNALTRATFYYNFLNYSIIAGAVYVICLVLSSFKEEKIRKRTIISQMNYKKHNRILLLSNAILIIILWIFYIILSFILIGDVMFTYHGLVLIANSFVFSICALCMAFLVSNLISSKNAVNGIVNVIGLGSSFLCGAFVPVEWLPDAVLKIAHILPSYWYIQNNELIKNIEVINIETLKPIFGNIIMVFVFSLIFIVSSNIVSRYKRKVG